MSDRVGRMSDAGGRRRLTPAERRRRLEEADRLLGLRGVPLSDARRAILEVVYDLGTHPSADEVLVEAVRRRPGLGRATVYRALESFVALGVLTKACHPGTAVRYDADLSPHHHLVCLRCDRIEDLAVREGERPPAPDVSGLGFEVADVQLHLRGICRECRTMEDPS
jgi:Fe2+ or Zn2+ uptake regulation protein